MTAFALGPGVHEIVCVYPLKGNSISPSPLGLHSFSWSSKPTAVGAYFLLVWDPLGWGNPTCSSEPHLRRTLQYNPSPGWGPTFPWLCLGLSCSTWDLSFLTADQTQVPWTTRGGLSSFHIAFSCGRSFGSLLPMAALGDGGDAGVLGRERVGSLVAGGLNHPGCDSKHPSGSP